MEPDSPRDRELQVEATRHIALRIAGIGLPLAGVVFLLRALGLPWWLIAIGVTFFLWYLLFEA